MKLYYREYGTYSDQRSTLILLHGLLGSSSNWHGIARQMEAGHHIIVPDLRNHGRSPHADDVGYPAHVADLLELLDEHGLDSVQLVGHSMGGKAAMQLALEQPQRVSALTVVDIAPVTYPNRFQTIYSAMTSLDLFSLTSRNSAEHQLMALLHDKGLCQYLLQNLVREGEVWRWRVNMEGLQVGMSEILGFPTTATGRQYPGATLFIYGSESDYVTEAHGGAIQDYFPYARLRMVSAAGHWVYSEQPEAFIALLTSFLNQDL